MVPKIPSLCNGYLCSLHALYCAFLQISHPLCDRNQIYARLDAVSELLKSMGSSKASEIDSEDENPDIKIVHPEIHHLISSVLTTLGQAPDVQRGITRIFYRTATPSEVAKNFLTFIKLFKLFTLNSISCFFEQY